MIRVRKVALSTVLVLGLPSSLFLTGCSLTQSSVPAAGTGAVLRGSVHGGRAPIVGAHVYLFAANTTGYGSSSVSLLTAGGNTVLDTSVGATNGDYYVVTDSNGGFGISGDYACMANTQVYLYALGGDPGSGTNSAAGLMAVLGNCPGVGNFLTATPFIAMNEVSTIAAAYAFAGFATDATHVSSSGTSLAQVGIANAFASAANLETLSTGVALTTTPAGNGVVPQTTINTLGNILASCVNSTGPGSPSCTTLLSAATSDGTKSGTPPADTATAAINIAHHPGSNIPLLCNLQTPIVPFQPDLVCGAAPIPFYPNDFTIGLQFTGGGLNQPSALAVDGFGNVWVANYAGGGIVTELSSTGAFLSGASGYSTLGGVGQGIAIDSIGNAWITNGVNPPITTYAGSISELSSSGAVLSGTGGFTAGGVNGPHGNVVANPTGIGIDASGNVWFGNGLGSSVGEISNAGSYAGLYGTAGLTSTVALSGDGKVWAAVGVSGNAVSVLTTAGVAVSPLAGYTGGGLNLPRAVAIDNSGNAWIANTGGNSITKMTSAGAFLSGSGYTGGGLTGPDGIAIDGAGDVFVANGGSSSITELSSAGAVLSVPFGYTGGGTFKPLAIAMDGSGNAWVVNTTPGNSPLTELIGIGTPVVTPLAVGVANNTLATKP